MTEEEQETAMQQDRWRRLAADDVGTLLFETAGDDAAGVSYLFRQPLRTLTAEDEASLAALLEQIDEALEAGFYVAGVLRYEAGYAFERVRNRKPRSEPLAWFGVYSEQERATFPHRAAAFLLKDPLCVSMETPLPQYLEQVAEAQRYIEAGDTYQVNLTTAMTSSYRGEVLPLYKALAAQQPAPFSAFLHLPGDEFVLSFSPELFFSLDADRTITVRPMKGTAPLRGSIEADRQQMEWLAADEKNHAEHVMIVDLLRSDLGRLCVSGSIRADRLFEVERYRTLLQMTSTIEGRLRPKVSVAEVLRALFPSGSMTGAPKPRTMEIIAELETPPRGVYSGAIGFASPHGAAVFSVAIRTIVLQDGALRMGVGSGIVADSTPRQEHEECWLKSEFLLRASPAFSLFETLLWDDGFTFLDEHLKRLKASAEQLHFCFDRTSILKYLTRFTAELAGRQRVRLLLESSGDVRCEAMEAVGWASQLDLWLAPRRSWSKDSFLRHKTTFRPLYEEGLHHAHELGFDEAIFTNEREELTEGSISSLLVLLDGVWITPALASGVLPGVARSRLLGRGLIREGVVALADLQRAQAIAVCNGVRGIGAVRSITLRDGSLLQFDAEIDLSTLEDQH